MGLRVAEGIDLRRYETLAGRAMSTEKISALQNLGLVTRDGSRLAATLAGRRVLNAVIAELAD
jgi:coproporphyrinogen III oxidase-like Fe-S oxidoreductase